MTVTCLVQLQRDGLVGRVTKNAVNLRLRRKRGLLC